MIVTDGDALRSRFGDIAFHKLEESNCKDQGSIWGGEPLKCAKLFTKLVTELACYL